MRLKFCWAMLALAFVSGCQTTAPQKPFEPACTPRRYDAGFCDLPSNFNLFATIVTGELQ